MINSNTKPINNTYFWILLGINPLLILYTTYIDTSINEKIIIALSLGIPLIMIILDRKEIIKAEYKIAPSLWWILFLPGYILERVSLTHRKYRLLCFLYFAIYIILVILVMTPTY